MYLDVYPSGVVIVMLMYRIIHDLGGEDSKEGRKA